MRIESSSFCVEGFCSYGTLTEDRSVIKFTKSEATGKWSTASSMCIPSDIGDAKKVIDCYRLALAAIN